MSVETDKNLNGFTKPPLCPFCSAPWTDEMIAVEAHASQQYSSVGPEPYGTVRINCASCEKLIYQKDFGD